jgi:hypothetical protein
MTGRVLDQNDTRVGIPGRTLKNSCKNLANRSAKMDNFCINVEFWQYSASERHKGSEWDWIRILNTSEREAYMKTHIINALDRSELSRTSVLYQRRAAMVIFTIKISKSLPEVHNLVQEFVDENKVVLHILLRDLAKVVLHHLHKL